MVREKSHRWGTYSEDDYKQMYAQNWSAFTQFERDEATIQMGKRFDNITTVADMSAGGAKITPEIAAHYGVSSPMLGDFWNGYGYPYAGPITETTPQLPVVDLFVCSETIEHLEDPDEALRVIRSRCRYLLLTTPIAEEPHMVSHGHLWTWRREDVEKMLVDASFEVLEFQEVLIFGLWRCQ